MYYTSSIAKAANYFFRLGCLFSFNLSLAQVAIVFDAPPGERVEKLMQLAVKNSHDTTLLFDTFDRVATMAKAQNDELLFWYTQLFEANYQKSFRFTDLAKKTAFMKNKQAYFEQSPYPIIHAAYYFYLSNAYFQNLEFTEAFKFSFRARQIFEKIGYQNIPEATEYLDNFFGFHYYFEEYKMAINYSILAEKYNKRKLIGDWFILNNRGVAYLKLHDYANAEKAFLQTIAAAKANGKDVYVGIGSGNYGNTLRLQGKYKEALPYLYKDVAINEQKVPDNTAITCLYIAYALIKLDSAAKAQTYIKQSLKLQPSWFWSNYGLMHYEVNALYYQKIGNLSEAIRYKDSLAVKKDSLRQVFDNRLVAAAEAQILAEKYLSNLHTIETEKNNAVLRRNIFIAVIIIVAIALIYAVNQRRKREKQVQAVEKKRAEDLLAQYIEHIKSKNELIEKMSLELNQTELQTQDSVVMGRQIESLRQSVILTESNWLEFKQLFERVYPHFFDNLLSKYQNLTPAEIRLLALLKLNIASREMAYMLGVSIESLRKARYRLRKKLETVQADTDLRGLIGSL